MREQVAGSACPPATVPIPDTRDDAALSVAGHSREKLLGAQLFDVAAGDTSVAAPDTRQNREAALSPY